MFNLSTIFHEIRFCSFCIILLTHWQTAPTTLWWMNQNLDLNLWLQELLHKWFLMRNVSFSYPLTAPLNLTDMNFLTRLQERKPDYRFHTFYMCGIMWVDVFSLRSKNQTWKPHICFVKVKCISSIETSHEPVVNDSVLWSEDFVLSISNAKDTVIQKSITSSTT